MATETETVYARIPKDLKQQLDARGAAEQRTLAVMVSRAIAHFLACPDKPVRQLDEF